ncbi:MAG: glycosyltransferase family 4 protein [bacterium]
MEKLKVLMFGWEYAPIITGGLGIVCRDLAEQLIQQNIAIDFILPKLPANLPQNNINFINSSGFINSELYQQFELNSQLIPYAGLNQYSTTVESNNDLQTLYGNNLLNEIRKYAYSALEISRKSQFDVIHAHDWMTFPAAINAKWFSGKPLVVHIHSTEYDRSGNHPYQEIVKYEQLGLDAADVIIAVSERTKQQLIELYHQPAEKIKVIHNAIANSPQNKVISAAPVAQLKKEKIVLFLGRLVAQKGADYLLKAAKLVLRYLPDTRFVFVGKGEMLPSLINLSIDLGISGNVSFVGFLEHDQIDQAYLQADLFVMPSVSEPFGLTTLEAIRNGTPVLISKQSGVSEVIPNSLKVDFWDIEEMADKILAVLKHEALSSSLVENSRNDLEQITWKHQAEKVVEIYRQMM